MDTPVWATPTGRLASTATWLLTQTAAHASRLVAEGMAEVGARGYHYRLLLTLQEHGPGSQTTLSRHSGIHVSDLVATVNELADAGLVERSPDPDDRRRNIVTITQAGRRRLDVLDREITRVQDELLEPLSPAERDHLRDLLKRLLEHHARRAATGV